MEKEKMSLKHQMEIFYDKNKQENMNFSPQVGEYFGVLYPACEGISLIEPGISSDNKDEVSFSLNFVEPSIDMKSKSFIGLFKKINDYEAIELNTLKKVILKDCLEMTNTNYVEEFEKMLDIVKDNPVAISKKDLCFYKVDVEFKKLYGSVINDEEKIKLNNKILDELYFLGLKNFRLKSEMLIDDIHAIALTENMIFDNEKVYCK